ncbi:MAG: enoyl-CoA hydratase-related protein, partial [Pseudomonadota bacterium]
MSTFTYSQDADGVVTLAWDQPDTSMNVMTLEGFREFEEHFDKAMADESVKGVIITSAKKDFAGGMDLSVLATIRAEAGDAPAKALFDFTMNGHRILRKIERNTMDAKTNKGGKPVAWASPGTSAGIGTEVALACHRRFMADNPKAKVGLPEIMVGIFPGAGGTTRVTRMMGAMAAAPILLEGKMLPPAKAKSMGLIDEVVPA